MWWAFRRRHDCLLRAGWGTQDVGVGATLGIHILGLEEAESSWGGWGETASRALLRPHKALVHSGPCLS